MKERNEAGLTNKWGGKGIWGKRWKEMKIQSG
jgi:hypothetical protein